MLEYLNTKDRPPQRMVLLDPEEHETVLATLKAMHDLLVWTLCSGMTEFDSLPDREYRSGFEDGYDLGAEHAHED